MLALLGADFAVFAFPFLPRQVSAPHRNPVGQQPPFTDAGQEKRPLSQVPRTLVGPLWTIVTPPPPNNFGIRPLANASDASQTYDASRSKPQGTGVLGNGG